MNLRDDRHYHRARGLHFVTECERDERPDPNIRTIAVNNAD